MKNKEEKEEQEQEEEKEEEEEEEEQGSVKNTAEEGKKHIAEDSNKTAELMRGLQHQST